jgi:8-oxo-dGTP pyrophosphatase MutT (NUDIX family)
MNRFHTLGDWVDAGGDVTVVLARDMLGRVMLQLRDDFDSIPKPGLWGLFGGHVEPGEALDNAVAREMAEETGLHFAQPDFVPFVRLVSDSGMHHFAYRLTPVVDAAKVSLQEGAGFAFIHSGQLDQLRLLPEARRVLEHYFATL